MNYMGIDHHKQYSVEKTLNGVLDLRAIRISPVKYII